MKIGNLSPYSGIKDLNALVNWVSTQLADFSRKLATMLGSLKFDDNFHSFKTTVTINAGQELAIPNQLPNGRIPSEWLVVDLQTEKAFSLVRGYATWTSDFVYIKNHGPDSVQVTLRFFE